MRVRGRWVFLIGLGLIIALGGVAGALVFGPSAYARLTRPQEGTVVSLTHPLQGAVVPLHSTIHVAAEAASARRVVKLDLWVNGQEWGERSFDPTPLAGENWSWTPSGEGEHELIVFATDAAGNRAESNAVRVLATAQADVRFPLDYTTVDGDSLDSLAEAIDSEAGAILDANPGLDSTMPLLPGVHLTLPVPVPNAPPAGPESGEAPAAPANPSPGPDQTSIAHFLVGIELLPQEQNSGQGFWLSGGKLVPDKPVDRLYLYVGIDGQPWHRLPEDPKSFLLPQSGVFDLAGYLDLPALEASPEPVDLRMEAWGWQGASLIFLGSYAGKVGGGLGAWPPKDTQLQVLAYEALGIPHYALQAALTGEDPTLDVVLDWDTSAPDALFGRWQVATVPFPAGPGLDPPGLVQEGVVSVSAHRFTLDFGDYFQKPAPTDGLFGNFGGLFQDAFDKLTNAVQGTQEPKQQFSAWLPQTFYVRVIPLEGVPPYTAKPTGSPSNFVIVRFLPSGQQLAQGPVGGPIYEARVVGFTSFREADSAYKACFVLSKPLDFPALGGNPTQWPAGTQSCGCPGIPCGGGGGDECGDFSLDGLGDCLEKGASALGSALESFVGFATNLYNDAKAFIVDTLSAGLCGDYGLGGVMGKEACKIAVNVGVNAGLAALGLPPEIPNFDKLFSEGLEYAIAEMASEVTGFDCDATCRELLKKAFAGASNPQQLFDEGLDYGSWLAADGLAEVGIDCDVQCQGLIENAAKGDLTPGNLSEAAVAAAAKEAAAQLNNNGYACGPDCEAKIAYSLQNGASLGQAASSASSQVPEPPLWAPHPLAVEQPAVLTVEIFRRWESAGATRDELDRCGLSVENLAVKAAGGIEVSGAVFEAKGIDLPVIQPGETMRIPIVLERAPWYAPPGALAAIGAEEAKDLPPGTILAGIVDPVFGDWHVLYYGSDVTFRLYGPLVLTLAGGELESVPCVSEGTWISSIPAP